MGLAPTDISHFWDAGIVHVLCEQGLVVIDVMDLNDEFRLGLHWSSCLSVDCLGTENVHRLLFSVQSPGGLDIPRLFIDNEEVPCSLARKDIFQ